MNPITFTKIYLKGVGPETVLIFYNKNVKGYSAIFSGFNIYYVSVLNVDKILNLKEINLNDDNTYENQILGIRITKSDTQESQCVMQLLSGSYLKITTNMRQEYYYPKVELVSKENDLQFQAIGQEFENASNFDLDVEMDFRL